MPYQSFSAVFSLCSEANDELFELCTKEARQISKRQRSDALESLGTVLIHSDLYCIICIITYCISTVEALSRLASWVTSVTSKVLLPVDDSGLVGHKIFELQEVKLCGAASMSQKDPKGMKRQFLSTSPTSPQHSLTISTMSKSSN